MLGNKGFVFLDTLIGIFIVMIMLSLVIMMASLKHGFQYEFKEEEMMEIWMNSRGNSVYLPEKPAEVPLLPPAEDIPLRN